MHWILQENLFKETEWENLVGTLERFGIPYSVHKVIPFIGELVPTAEPKHPKVVCFGSYSMRHSAKANRWSPGVYDLEPFDFRQQLAAWGKHMLNHDSVVCRFEDVKFDEYYNETDSTVFMRPIHDSKVFPGKCMWPSEFYEWQRKVCVLEEDYGDSLTKDTLVQWCKPKKIYTEIRFWVAGGKIVTASVYKQGPQVFYLEHPRSAYWDFVEARIAEWQPHRAFVIDIADTEDGLRIVEINTINSAGFYAADVQKLVMALEELEA